MISHVKFVTIPTTDRDRALTFWTEIVGFRVLTDQPKRNGVFSASVWVAVTRDPAQLTRITAGREWKPLLDAPGTRPWTDEHASILGAVRWQNLLGKVF